MNGEIYDHACHWFTNQGIVAFNVEYRLADEAPYPGGAHGLRSAAALRPGSFGGWRETSHKPTMV
ncbi:MAG TPA: hypothetical protein VEN30_22985 [Paraburkholderia sp.]|nr:hypothetical protein [Paraburkholderia sp.]